MIEFIQKTYDLSVKSFIKLTNKTYKIITDKNEYILKYVHDARQEMVFSRLSMLNEQIFLIPIKSLNDRFIERYKELYLTITKFIKDELQINKDIRLHFYIKSIALLHKNTNYGVNVNDGFFDESLNYLENKIIKCKSDLKSKIERVERLDFYSPSDWYFLMNYNVFMSSLNEATRYIELLDEEWNKKDTINLCLTYQNFNYDHINVKYQKIVSLDNMVIAPCIYDLITIFNESYITRMDIKKVFNEYNSINVLEKYEVYWFLGYLFIPEYSNDTNIKKDISLQFNSLTKLNTIISLSNYLKELYINDESE